MDPWIRDIPVEQLPFSSSIEAGHQQNSIGVYRPTARIPLFITPPETNSLHLNFFGRANQKGNDRLPTRSPKTRLRERYQVIQSDPFIPQLEVTIHLWKGHLTIPKRSRLESPGSLYSIINKGFVAPSQVVIEGFLNHQQCQGWTDRKVGPYHAVLNGLAQL